MKRALWIGLILLPSVTFAQAMGSTNEARQANAYNLGAEFQIGYPSVRLKNPNGKNAIYDGVAVRGNFNIPIYRSGLEIFISPGIKYLDLKNVANTDAQVETANLIGAGAGLTLGYRYLQVGAKYFQEWSRHYSTGAFSGRTNYDLAGIEYFGGLYFRFDRLGVGLSYSNQVAEIDRSDTGLTSNTPYNETIYAVQFTFDMGESAWSLLGRLF